MPRGNFRSLLSLLSVFLFSALFASPAGAAVSKTSKRIIRASLVPVSSDFSAAALSTTSIKWSWSTGTFSGADTEYRLYTASASLAEYRSLTPGTSFFIDSGLKVDKVYTRWLTVYQGATPGSDSSHIDKYTYALPPGTFTLSTGTAESIYVTWHFSSATAYAIECSTNGGADYVRNREAFVPWQTIPLLSNKHYLIRVGAVNGDDELTPGAYSVIKTTITPPLTPPGFSAVAISSYTIQWQWSTGTFTGTGITGYRLYQSTTTPDDTIPVDGAAGATVIDEAALSPGTSYWIETFVDSDTFHAANSRHTRWIKALGNIVDPVTGTFVESLKQPVYQKYTYGIAPATTTAVWLDPDPYLVAHVWDDQVGLIWNTEWSTSGPRVGLASQFVIEYSTVAGFTVAVDSLIATGDPGTVPGLTENTKYDLRIGAINGDGEQAPANPANPFAYSRAYKVITTPHPPSDYLCRSFTDTALHCTWDPSTYVNPSYISGYFVGELHHVTVNGVDEIFWDPADSVAGVDSSEYSLDYMLTNSTHTVSIWVQQTDPDWGPANPHYPDPDYYYNHFGSDRLDTDGATFATPPNDVVFDTVGAHAVGMWWKEPQVPATQYFVQRSTNTDEKGPWVFVSSVTGSHYNDPGVSVSTAGLTPGTTYSYRVGSINLLGQPTIGLSDNTDGYRRDYSFVESTVTKHIAPTLYAVATGTRSITWSWTDTVPGVTSYNIYTDTGGAVAKGIAYPASSYAETNLPGPNTRYTRWVRSVAADGEGDYSAASALTLSNPPASVIVTSTGRHALSLGWSANESASYGISRSTDGYTWTVLKSSSDDFTAVSFNDTRLHYGTTFYYAVSGYNDDGVVSVSSAIAKAVTLPLPSGYTVVYATSAASVTAPLPLPSLVQITVDIPVGTPDGYFSISTDAAANPVAVPKSGLDTAALKLRNASLVSGSVVEMHLYDAFGASSVPAAPARITLTYLDAAGAGTVDGTTPAAPADTLNLFRLDTSALVWNQQVSSVDKTAKTVRTDVPDFSFYALGSVSGASTFSATVLSPTGIQWSWPLLPGADGYHLYSSSAPASSYIVLPASASFYIDNGLGVNKPYTRWLRPFTGAVEGSESAHIQKYTYALPPDDILLPPYTVIPGSVTATSIYVEWHWSTATAYDIQCSTNGGVDYSHNRAAFVPWQYVPLLSNKNYMIRMGAINGDNVVTPGVYSATHTFITPPLDMVISSAVAISPYAIQWSWSTGTLPATGITGYRIYDSDTGLIVYSTSIVSVSSWTETYADSPGRPAANSPHGRFIKAFGILQSLNVTPVNKYTYAVAPATCGPVSPAFLNVFSDAVNLDWNPRLGPAEASKYVIDYATAAVAQSSADFSGALTSLIVAGHPYMVTGLAWDTKHDFRIGAINGDNEQTPANFDNPYAYSARYKVITRALAPVVSCSALTDTSLHWSWSTGPYTNMGYISGYSLDVSSHTDAWGDFLWAIASIPGVSSNQYDYNPPSTDFSWLNPPESYLLTNSTYTRSVSAEQSWTPSCVASPADPACYYFFGGNPAAATCATFATPPNDVSFGTVTSRGVGIWWKEPQVPATQYRVERSTNLGEDGPWVFLSSVTGTNFQELGLTPSTTYSYRLGAINVLGIQTIGLAAATNGNRRDYSFVSSTMTRHVAPLFYALAATTASITWGWADTGTVSGVTSYNLYDSNDAILANFAIPASSWTEIGLSSANYNYTRRIRSIASEGTGDFAEVSTYTLTNAPVSLAVSSAGVHTMALTWPANMSTAYRIDRSTDLNLWKPLMDWSSGAVSTTSFTDTHLHFSATYYYAVRGYNHEGILSVSSAVALSPGVTLDLPARFTPVFTTAAVTQSTTAFLPGVGWIRLDIPAGAAPADGYIFISTDAAANPVGATIPQINTATGKLAPDRLLAGSMVELFYFDASDYAVTTPFLSPARITVTYPDADSDGLVDGQTPQMPADMLKLYTLDTSAWAWSPVADALLDKAGKTVYANISHFSFYSLGAVSSVGGTIKDVFAYPNPYKPGSGGAFDKTSFGEGIVFESLPAKARIKIFSVAGNLVAELNDDDGDGRAVWNARNKDGSRVASGVYIYVVSGTGGKKTGRIAVIK